MKLPWAALSVFLILSMFSPLISAGDDLSPAIPGKDDKCPVCGMFIAKYPDWISQIIFTNHEKLFFDGAKDLFKFYFNMKKYDSKHSPREIAKIFVTEYYDLKSIDARKAFFVVGSDVYGPMGHELIPFIDEASAREFMKDHKGKNILKFTQINPAVISKLD
jgi:copper chaperone NosL